MSGRLNICASCRVSEDVYRFAPCAMCAEDRLHRVFQGETICGHCGRKLTRYVRVQVGSEILEVGTTCAHKLLDDGAIEIL